MKITFIESPHEWQDRESIKVRNYGVERIISNLVAHGALRKEQIQCYDFSFDCCTTKEEAYRYLLQKMDLIQDSDIFGISVLETNYMNSLLLAALLKMKFPEAKIIFGGPAVTELDKEIMQLVWQTDQQGNMHKIGFIDFLIPGMAEESMVSFVQHFHKEEFHKVPNLIWMSNNKLTINNKKYPPENWKKILPMDIKWNAVGNYKEDHFLLLASYGCYANCDFCTMITKEPFYVEREIPFLIEEIQHDVEIARKRGVEKIFIQPIHQNYAHRIGQFMDALEKAKVIAAGVETYLPLLSKIQGVGFTSRADTLLIARNKEIVESIIKKYPEIHFELFVGIENFSDHIMEEIGKKISQRVSIEAMRFLIYLQKSYSNFNYLLSFIGLTQSTTLLHISENLQIMEELFVSERSLYPVHYFLNQPLRLGVKMSRKFNIARQLGYYLPDNTGQVQKEGNLAYPRDQRTKQFLETYYSLLPLIPDYVLRKRLFQELVLRGVDILEHSAMVLGVDKILIEKYFLWAELYCAKSLIENIKNIDQIISICERTYYYGLQLLQKKLELERTVKVG